MSFEGKSGSQSLKFSQAPVASQGRAQLWKEDSELEIHWQVDAQGIRLVLPQGAFDFDWEPNDADDAEGVPVMRLRGTSFRFKTPPWIRKGEESSIASSSRSKKPTRVRAQMPGKVIRVLIQAGQEVEKNQPLAVIEAMKMENEIRSPMSGKVEQVFVQAGQAIESGAELFLIQSGTGHG